MIKITTRSKLLVEASDTKLGVVVAKAVRADVTTTWFFGMLVKNKMTNVGEIYPYIPEVLSRKVVLAVVKELAMSAKY
jgi:hypothetical protein